MLDVWQEEHIATFPWGFLADGSTFAIVFPLPADIWLKSNIATSAEPPHEWPNGTHLPRSLKKLPLSKISYLYKKLSFCTGRTVLPVSPREFNFAILTN